MTAFLLGETAGVPFDRAFFNASLDALVTRFNKGPAFRLVLSLTDGTTIDLCQIEEAAESYLVLRGYRGEEESCELSLNVVPYGLIYRLELQSRAGGGTRLGFTPGRPTLK